MKALLLLFLLAAPLLAQVPNPQVPFSGRIGPGGNFPLFNGGTLVMSTDADRTMAFPEMTASVIRVTSSVALTATRNLIAPSTQFGYEFTVQNATTGGQSIQIIGSSGTGVTIPNGQVATVVFDGTNYVAASGGGGGNQSGNVGEVVFQGVSDAVKDSTCSTTSGSPNLTCTDAPFTTCPTGKTVSVTDGLWRSFNNTNNGQPQQEGNSLITTILSCPNPSTAIMATNATHTNLTTTARWGTDNGPALFAQANAPTTRGKNFIVPAGNYLVRSQRGHPGGGAPSSDPMTGTSIDVYSGTSYTITAAAHIYWTGPSGCSGTDPACVYWDQGYRLFYLHDPITPGDTWAPDGTHNVYIRLDGIIEGDNSADNGVGVPYLNASAIVFGLGNGTNGSNGITSLTIDGSGSIVNTYGFSFHTIGGSDYAIKGIVHRHVAKGLNVNGHGVNESFNTFIETGGALESTGTNIVIIANRFNHSGAISVGGTGGGAVCNGYVVASNTFTNMASDNLHLSQCPVGAIIMGNAFDIPAAFDAQGNWLGNNFTAINVHDDSGAGDFTPTHDNLIIGNTFFAHPGCYAALFTYGTVTGGNVYSNNYMTGPCLFGYTMNNYRYDHPESIDIIKGDTLVSTLGGVSAPSTGSLELQGPVFFGTGASVGGSGIVTPNSWWSDSTGMHGSVGGAGSGGGGVNLPQSEGVLYVTSGGGGITPPGGSFHVGYDTVMPETAVGSGGPVYMPFFVSSPSDVVDCNIYFGATVAGKAYCFIYDSNPNEQDQPGALLCSDPTGTTILANSWNKISNLQISSCPSFVSAHKYYMAFRLDEGASMGMLNDPPPAYYSYYETSPCCAPLNPSVAPVNFPNYYSMYLTMQTTSARAVQVSGRQQRNTYSLATTLGTGYLHSDGTNYTWDAGGGGGGGSWTVTNNTNTSAIPVNVNDHVSVGDPTPLSILNGVSGAVGGTCGANTLASTSGQWAIACNASNEIIIPNTINVAGVKVNGTLLTGGNVSSIAQNLPMSTTTGATVFTQTMDTPVSDSTYYLTWQLQQVDTGSGGACNAGTLGVVLAFTEAISNAPITAQLSGRAFNAPGGTNGFSAGTTIDATNYFVGFPFEFTAKANVPVTFTLTQLTASNCTNPQNFMLRAHLKAW